MTVSVAKNGTWMTQFRCKDRTGNEVHKCKRGFASAEEAQKWEDEFIAACGCTMEMTFGEFVEIYREDVSPRIREHTMMNKEHVIRTKLLPFFGKMRMCDIESIDIIRWQNELMSTSRKNGKSYSPTYLRSVNNQLTAIINHACRYYGLHPNPSVKTMKMGAKEAKEMQFWTKDEYLRFAETMMARPPAFIAFEILYWTGLREGELLALTPSNFDFSKGKLSVTKSYQRLKGRDVITDPKTPKSVRVVKMPKFLSDEVRDYVERKKGSVGPRDRLFPVTKSTLAKEMKAGSEKAGVKRIRIHDLRHSHVSLLIDMGFSALAVADRLGQEAIDITYRYAHLFPDVQDDMAEALDGQGW